MIHPTSESELRLELPAKQSFRFDFGNRVIRRSYEAFQRELINLSLLTMYLCVATVAWVGWLIKAVELIHLKRSSGNRLAVAYFVANLIFLVGHVFLGIMILISAKGNAELRGLRILTVTKVFQFIKKFREYFKLVFVFSGVIAAGAVLVIRTIAKDCLISTVWAPCNRNVAPVDQMLVVFILPAVFHQLIPFGNFYYTVLQWGISAAFVIASVLLSDVDANCMIIAYELLFGVFLWLMEHSRRMNFVGNDVRSSGKSWSSSGSSDKISVDGRTIISQHVIANINHDLLTPVQALKAGLDALQSMVEESFPLESGATNTNTNSMPTTASGYTHPCTSDESCRTINNFDAVVREGYRRSSFLKQRSQFSGLINSLSGTVSFLSMMIYRLLDASKIGSGVELVPNCEFFDYISCAKLAVDCIVEMQSNYQVQITDNLIGKQRNSLLFSDKRWFEGSLMCLIGNAVKYSRNNNVPVDLSFHIEEKINDSNGSKECMFTVQVRDTGSDIADEDRERFFQSPDQNDRAVGGSGLGLFVLARHMQALGGYAGSRPRSDGQTGSVFWFSIPYKWMPKLPPSICVMEDGKERIMTSRTVPSQSTVQTHVSTKSFANYSRKSHSGRTDCTSYDQWDAAISSPSNSRGEEGASRGRFGFEQTRQKSRLSRFRELGTSHSSLVATPVASCKESVIQERRSLHPNDVLEFTERDLVFDSGSPPTNKHSAQLSVPLGQLTKADQFKIPSPSEQHLSILLIGTSMRVENVQYIVGQFGHIVELVSDGSVALSRMKETYFDLVLIDLQLPLVSSIEIVKKFREFENTFRFNQPRQFVAGMDANGDDAIKWALSSGVNNVIPMMSKGSEFVSLLELKHQSGLLSPLVGNINHLSPIVPIPTPRSRRGSSFDKQSNSKRKVSVPMIFDGLDQLSARSNFTSPRALCYSVSTTPERRSRSNSYDVEKLLMDQQKLSKIASMGVSSESLTKDGSASKDDEDEFGNYDVNQGMLRHQMSSPSICPQSMWNVLLVDDSLPIQKMMKLSLSKAGHAVEVQSDGLAALNRMKEQQFDVVLMDLQMPIMGGVEAVKCFREFENTFRRNEMSQFVIGMSACGDDKIVKNALDAGIDAFLTKPFQIADLVKVVSAHVARAVVCGGPEQSTSNLV